MWDELSDAGLASKTNEGVVYLWAIPPCGYGSERYPVNEKDKYPNLRYWNNRKATWQKRMWDLRLTVTADSAILHGYYESSLGLGVSDDRWGHMADGLQGCYNYLKELNAQGFNICLVANEKQTNNICLIELPCFEKKTID